MTPTDPDVVTRSGKDSGMKRTALPNGWHMVDDREVVEVDYDETPVSLPFPARSDEADPSTVEAALRAADDACRRIEVLARELVDLASMDFDDDGPRAA